MPPDAWLILLSTLLAVVGYLLWVTERLPRVRALLILVAVLAFVLSVVVHDVITSRQAASADDDWGARTHRSPPAERDATTS